MTPEEQAAFDAGKADALGIMKDRLNAVFVWGRDSQGRDLILRDDALTAVENA